MTKNLAQLNERKTHMKCNYIDDVIETNADSRFLHHLYLHFLGFKLRDGQIPVC